MAIIATRLWAKRSSEPQAVLCCPWAPCSPHSLEWDGLELGWDTHLPWVPRDVPLPKA